jgi:serine/threonine-protein kinase
LDKELGSGGFATVYAGYDLQKNQQIAVKITNDSISRNSEHLKAFLDELNALARLPQHPNIIGIYDYGVVGEKTFLVMDYAPHGTLEARLQQAAPRPLDFRQSGTFFRQIAGALAHAHQHSIVHRDIKPENMLFMAGDKLVVSDFGLARRFRSQMTQSINLFGSPPYVAPERWSDKVGPASDVYALGVILYQMLTGSLPFQAGDPLAYLRLHVYEQAPRLRDKRPDLPAGLDELVGVMLAKEPEQRPTASELINLYDWALQQATGYYQSAPLDKFRRGTTAGFAASGPVRTSGRLPLGADALPPDPIDATPHVQTLTSAIHANPKQADNFVKRARAYLTTKTYNKAVADFTEAIKLDPHNPNHYLERAKAFQEARQHQEALGDSTQAIKLAPQYPDAYEQRGDILLATGQYSQAIEDFEAALYFNSTHPDVYNKRAMAYKQRAAANLEARQQGKADDSVLRLALDDYNRAIELNPRDARLYLERGNVHRAMGKPRKAVADYNYASKLRLHHSDLYMNLGNAFLAMKQYRKALNAYNEALKLPGWSVNVYENRSFAYYSMRKYKPALADCNEALKLRPNDASYLAHRGHVYFAMRDYQKALADYQASLHFDPSNADLYFNQAMTLAALGRLNEALNMLQDQLKKTKDRRAQRTIRDAITRLEQLKQSVPVRNSRNRFTI